MKEITDPELLSQLNNEVTDPKILRQLNAPAKPSDFSLKETVKNIPGSALQYAKDVTAPIHSYDTFFPGMANLGQGLYEKLTPGVQEHEKYADAAGQFYQDRYGKDEYPEEGIDNFGDYMKWRNKRKVETYQRDPIGTISDLSLVGGLATAPTKANRALSKSFVAIDPMNMAANAGKIALKKSMPKKTPAKMYERTAKFSTTIPKKKRDVMVQTALDEKLTPTGKGVAKLENLTDIIDNKIETLISEATEGGGKVSANAVFADLSELRGKLGSAVQTDGMGNLNKINKVAKSIGANQKRTGQEFYTVAELQQLKRNLYKSAKMDVKQFKADDAVNQARKNIARKSKGMIEEKIPPIKAINERYGRLIDLQEPLTRSANRIDNLNAISINQPLNVGAGSVVAGPAGAAGAGLLTALNNPQIRPKIAMYLNELQKSGLLDLWMDNNYIPYAARQGLLQAEKSTD